MRILKNTNSLCNICFRKLDAEIVAKENKVYLIKTCSEHGKQEVLIWSNAANYLDWAKYSLTADIYSNGCPAEKGCPFDCGYCQEHQGTTCTAVIEVTDRCNMRCNVCFASGEKTGSDLPVSKIKEMLDYIKETQGLCSLQLSGGECTLRDDLSDIVIYAKSIGFKHLQINTNGIRLAEDLDYAKKLKDAGTDLIYLGFDSVESSTYMKIRNRDMKPIKDACIKNCGVVNLGVILVPVIIKGLNNNQIGKIINYGKMHMPTVKGIHFQPASQFGRFEMDNSEIEDRYTFPDLIKDMELQTRGEINASHIVPRKKQSAYCSFSSAYYLDKKNQLVAITRNDQDAQQKQIAFANSSNDEKMSIFARKTNDFTERYWKQNKAKKLDRDSNLTKFNNRVKEYSFAISAMPFQDVCNIDLERVKGCCVSVIDPSLKTIPLCLYYLTNLKGERLYRGGKCTV